MGKWLKSLLLPVVAAGVLVAGCRPQGEPEPAGGPAVPAGLPTVLEDRDAAEAAPKEPIPIEVPEVLDELTPEPTAVPEVKLTDANRSTCLVGVGDTMPDGELATVEGESISFDTLKGGKATVVYFWAAGESDTSRKIAFAALEDLQADALGVYGEKGLSVVAINGKDPAEGVKQVLAMGKIEFPVLLDAEGRYFGKVATERVPRIYLLDAAGKIVWFDVEYSETTRQMLTQSLKVMFAEQQPASE